MSNSGPLTVAITAPAGTTRARAMVTVTLEVTGAPDLVVLLIDSMPTVQVLPPYTSATFDSAALTEASHQLAVRATNTTHSADSPSVEVIVDRTAPALVRRWPSGSGWLGEAFGVEFSEPVIASTVTASALTAAYGANPAPTTPPVLTYDGLLLRAKTTASPPDVPVTLTLTLGAGLTDLAGNPVAPETWSVQVGRWDSVSLGVMASSPRLAVDGVGAQYVVASEGPSLVVRKVQWGRIEPVGAPLTGSSAGLAIDAAGRPVIAYVDGSTLMAQRFENGAWVSLGTVGSGSAPDLVIDSLGNPLVAFSDASALRVSKWDGAAWVPAADVLLVTTTAHSLLLDALDVPHLAYVEAGRLNVAAATGLTGWASLGGALNISGAETVRSPSLARNATTLYVTWEEHGTVHASQWDGTAWARMWRPLDIDNKSPAFGPQAGVGPNGALTIVWTEQTHYGAHFTQCARWLLNPISSSFQWEPCGGEAAAFASKLSGPALAMYGDVPVLAVVSSTGLEVKRFNGVGVGTHYGLQHPPAQTTCNMDTPHPQLSATECFDLSTNPPTPAGDLVPFDLVSPLWSDGALKRRWIRLPPGGTIGYQKNGPFTYPAGTMMVKEFSYERDPADPATRRPTETRFMVKREDAGWEGFSYQWDDAFSDATLLTNTTTTERKFWPYVNVGGADAGYTQLYPGNQECFSCHRTASGFVLGMHGGQLNRSYDYGGGHVDNQLRALQHIGYFGPDPLGAAVRWVNVGDQSETLQSRVRGYLAANCSHCHRPGGLRPTRDFRWETPFENTHICDSAAPLGREVEPGDAGASLMYMRISTRSVHGAPYGQMPPIATDVQDWGAVGVVERWINSMTSCP